MKENLILRRPHPHSAAGSWTEADSWLKHFKYACFVFKLLINNKSYGKSKRHPFLNKEKPYRFVYKIKKFETHMNNLQCLYPGKTQQTD